MVLAHPGARGPVPVVVVNIPATRASIENGGRTLAAVTLFVEVGRVPVRMTAVCGSFAWTLQDFTLGGQPPEEALANVRASVLRDLLLDRRNRKPSPAELAHVFRVAEAITRAARHLVAEGVSLKAAAHAKVCHWIGGHAGVWTTSCRQVVEGGEQPDVCPFCSAQVATHFDHDRAEAPEDLDDDGADPCEGCSAPSVTSDVEGVPLCHDCATLLSEEAAAEAQRIADRCRKERRRRKRAERPAAEVSP